MIIEPTYDQTLMYLLDLVKGLALGNAACIAIYCVMIWDVGRRSQEPNPKTLMLLSDHLFDIAKSPIVSRDEVPGRMTFMLELSLEHLAREAPVIVDANTYLQYIAQVRLINNIWNYVWDKLPVDGRFYRRDAFEAYYKDLNKADSADDGKNL